MTIMNQRRPPGSETLAEFTALVPESLRSAVLRGLEHPDPEELRTDARQTWVPRTAKTKRLKQTSYLERSMDRDDD